MKTKLHKQFEPSRRTICCVGLGAFFISACEAKPVKTRINISFFSYVNRPIFDVYMNGTDFGMAPAQGFYGSNSVMVAQVITLGPQKVTWRRGDTGETITAKNTPEIKEIPPGVKWLALHVYDDDTVEIAFSKGSPDELSTARGKKIIEAAERKNGK